MSDAAPERPDRRQARPAPPPSPGAAEPDPAIFALGVAVLAVGAGFHHLRPHPIHPAPPARRTAPCARLTPTPGTVRATLRANPASPTAALEAIPDVGPAEPLLQYRGVWSNTQPQVQPGQPSRRAAAAGHRGGHSLADAVLRRSAAVRRRHPPGRRPRQLLRGRASGRAEVARSAACGCRSSAPPRSRRRSVSCSVPSPPGGRSGRWPTPRRRHRRSPAGVSAPGWSRARTRTSRCWPGRSTTWRLRSSNGSSAMPGSRRT